MKKTLITESSEFAVTFNLLQLIIWLILYDHKNISISIIVSSHQQVNKPYNLIFKSKQIFVAYTLIWSPCYVS